MTYGVMVWIEEDSYEELFSHLVNIDGFIECEIVEQVEA